MSLYDLLNAFAGISGRTEKKEERTIKFDEVLVSDKIKLIIDMLQNAERIDFFSLFAEESTRGEIIATFLAILELTKIHKIKIMQSNNYEDIAVFRTFEPGSYNPDEFIVTSVNI
jgi:segregation and condensation protein A